MSPTLTSTVVRLDLEVQTDAEKNSHQPGDALVSFPRVGENAKCPEMSVYSIWHIKVEFCCFSLTTKQQLTGKFLALLSKGRPGAKTEWRLQATGVRPLPHPVLWAGWWRSSWEDTAAPLGRMQTWLLRGLRWARARALRLNKTFQIGPRNGTRVGG